MLINEIITEKLTFYGSKCTKDCSGHRAGFAWSIDKDLGIDKPCNSHSKSFNTGCLIAQRAKLIWPNRFGKKKKAGRKKSTKAKAKS